MFIFNGFFDGEVEGFEWEGLSGMCGERRWEGEMREEREK